MIKKKDLILLKKIIRWKKIQIKLTYEKKNDKNRIKGNNK